MGSADGARRGASDLSSLSRLLPGCDVELVLLDAHAPAATVHRGVHDQALLCTLQTGFACRGRFVLPADRWLLASFQQTDESVSWCHGTPLSNGSLLTLAPGASADFVLSAGSALTWALLPQTCWQPAAHALAFAQADAAEPRSAHLHLPVGHPLQRFYLELGERLGEERAQLSDRFLDEIVQHHGRALAQAGEHGRAISGRGRRTHYRMLRRAEDYLRTNLRHNLYINDICNVTGVSERALRYAFDDLLGMSPNRYLSMLRLCAAYRGLADADPQRSSVKAIALSCGLWDLSRFAENYRRLFGELPRETLNRPTD
ncbi:MAG TPA: helix-turn-helix domain-containing protein [Stenotrophomonas sp.]|nr:helix-turn-helix domain-containing protein [Stenotrophomonas sp.]